MAAAEAGREAAAAGCRLPGGSDDSEVLTLTCAVCQLANPLFALAGFLVLAGVMVAIRFRRPGFFERWIRLPLRSQWRRWSVYRYKWPATMDFAELNRYRSNGTRIPCATAP